MTEEFALRYAETRRSQLGAESFDVSFRHLGMAPAEKRAFRAQGQMWLITQADTGIRVQSDTGQYYPLSNTILEHAHEHTGQLTVANNSPAIRQVQFVVITWRYPAIVAVAPAAPMPPTVAASAPVTVSPSKVPVAPVSVQNQGMPSLPAAK